MLTRSEAQKHVDPHKDWIIAAFRAAEARLEKYRTEHPEDFRILSSRAKANMMSDFLMYEILARRIGKTGVTVSEKRGRITLMIDGMVAMRFKKLTSGLRSRYSRTQAALSYFESQLPLEEMPGGLTNTVGGYVLDDFGSINAIYLTCPVGNRNEWVFELGDADAGSGFATLPVEPVAPTGTIVKAKRPAEEETRKADES